MEGMMKSSKDVKGDLRRVRSCDAEIEAMEESKLMSSNTLLKGCLVRSSSYGDSDNLISTVGTIPFPFPIEEEEENDSNGEISDGEVLKEISPSMINRPPSPASRVSSSDNVPQFELCSSLYKRRGGLRRMQDNWQLRCFTLYGSVLCYYESPDADKADPSRPRSRIDLNKEETLTDMKCLQKPSAPSSFLLTVNFFLLGTKRKWEMCCMDKATQEQWYEALSRFDGKPESFIYGSLSPVPSPMTPKKKIDKLLRQSEGDSSMKKSKRSSQRKKKQSQRMKSKDVIGSFLDSLFDSDYFMYFNGLNIVAYIIRFSSIEICIIAVIVSNLYLWKLLRKKRLQLKSDEAIIPPNDSFSSVASEQDEFCTLDIRSPGMSIKRATPAGETANTIQLKGGVMESSTVIEACADANATYDSSMSNAYWNVSPSNFNLRIGPNYRKMKCKAPSQPALFNLYSVDFIRAPTGLKYLENAFTLPVIPGVTDQETIHGVPPMIVAMCSAPIEEPSLLSTSIDGPSYIAVVYLVISPKTKKELQDIQTASPAVKLLSEWCQRSPTDYDFRGRFKVIGILDNIESHGIPSFVAGYNGKPVLINKSGTFNKHEKYIEMAVNVHNFNYIAKKCLFQLYRKFEHFSFNIGFTIEGREDNELPEILLGGCSMIRLDLKNIIGIDTN